MPRTTLASPSRKTMSPSRRRLQPHWPQCLVTEFVGSGGSCPANRARVASGPQKLPVQLAGFIQSVGSVAPGSEFQSAIVQRQNQAMGKVQVHSRVAVLMHPAPSWDVLSPQPHLPTWRPLNWSVERAGDVYTTHWGAAR